MRTAKNKPPPSYFELLQELERLNDQLDYAGQEIVRLRHVIDDHASQSAGRVSRNYDIECNTHIEDYRGMITHVTMRPLQQEFILAQDLSGWSEDHKQAFHGAVVRGFSESAAEYIGRSIWGAKKR